MAYDVTGTGGSDTLNQSADAGPGTIVGLAGDDCIFTGTGLATVTGDAGNDTVVLQAGNTGTVDGGTENDSIFANGNNGSMTLFGRNGGDTINTSTSTSRRRSSAATIHPTGRIRSSRETPRTSTAIPTIS